MKKIGLLSTLLVGGLLLTGCFEKVQEIILKCRKCHYDL